MDTISYIVIAIGIGCIVLIGRVSFKILGNKGKAESSYSPFDDVTRGTADSNSSGDLAEDTRHTTCVEEKE